ncbi:MAG TPA: MFS transporter [Acidimicrobiales bacterium]|jgi:EmrB/QacA subfamily drug resistance transporter|nr:MFS transporter [Acidimicrobiales bacterium]
MFGSNGSESTFTRTIEDRRHSIAVGLRAHFSFATLLAILFLTFLDNTIASAVLTSVQSKLHAGVSQLQWVVGGYALAFASLMLICGSLSDNFGRKRVMLIGVVIFCAGSLVCAFAGTPAELIAGRVVMGVGAAGSEPSTLSMIRHIYPDKRIRARALGAWAAVSGLALALGPVIGGVLVGLWTWRAVFWFNFIFGTVVFVMGAVTLPESVNEIRRRIDWLGFLLAGVAVGFATYATIAGETWGYFSGGVLTLYSIAGACFIAYFIVESNTTHPMLNVRWVRNRAFAGSAVIAFTSYFAIFSIFFFVALYLEVIGSVSAYTLARDFLPMLAGIVAAALFTGRWVGRIGSRVPMTVGCLLAGLGVLLTDAVISPTAGLSTLGWTMGLAGIGFGMIVVPVNSTALVSIPANNSGIAASTINTARELGAVTGVAILGSIVNGQLTVNLTRRLTEIGVPASFRQEIIEDVVTGTAASKASAESRGSGAAVKHIINEVIHAAYGAFTHGLNLALTVSGILLLVSGAIAYFTGTAERSSMVKDDEDVVAA